MQKNTSLNAIDILPLIFLGVLILFAIFVIVYFGAGRAPRAPMDQGFVYTDLRIYRSAGVWQFHYPHLNWSGGITGSLLVGIYKLVIPTSVDTLNYHVKILAALGYFGSAYALARLFLDRTLDQMMLLAILGSAGLQFLEPTTEVMSACFLNLFVIATKQRWPIITQAAFLSVFSLIKAELVPIGVVISLFWIVTIGRTWRQRAIFLLAFGGLVAILLFPAGYLYGGYLFSPIGSRGFTAFQLTYCDWYLFDYSACSNGAFKTITSLPEFVWLKPFHYLQFLVISFPHTLLSTLRVLGIFVVVFPAFALLVRPRLLSPEERFLLGVAAIVAGMSLIMGIAVGAMQPRYMTRVYCILAVSTFFCLERIAPQKHWVAKNFVAISLVIGTLIIVPNLLHLPGYISYFAVK
jgi:hypothetical protein